MTAGNLIAEEVRDVLRADSHAIEKVEQALEEVEGARAALIHAAEQLRLVHAALLEDREQRAVELGRLLDLRNDPLVLVRRYGAVGQYHSAARPCGWARRNIENYRSLPEGEAVRAGLSRCKACGERLDYDTQGPWPS